MLLPSADENCISQSPLPYVVLGLSCPGEKLVGGVESRSEAEAMDRSEVFLKCLELISLLSSESCVWVEEHLQNSGIFKSALPLLFTRPLVFCACARTALASAASLWLAWALFRGTRPVSFYTVSKAVISIDCAMRHGHRPLFQTV